MSMRDDFSQKTKDTLAKRVGFRCSKPDCRKLTCGPHEEVAKSVSIGVAAHITAAAPGGPRYDGSLSSEERRSVNNGIWLCQTHSRMIDNDEKRFPVELLQDWKQQAEQQASIEVEGSDPSKPLVSIQERFQEYLQSFIDEEPEWWIDAIDDDTLFELTSKSKKKGTSSNHPQEAEIQPILQAIQESQDEKILIWGSAGSGKSTLLKKIAVEAARKVKSDETAPIPILVKLISYETAGEYAGRKGLILKHLHDYDEKLSIEDIDLLIENKQLLLLIDGFNEASSKAREEIKRFCKRKPTIVTTRDPEDWWEIGYRLEIQPLSSQDVKKFFAERLPIHDLQQVNELCERVRDFGQTPLMVWMLYAIFRSSEEMPKTRGEAYRSFTALYERRAKEELEQKDYGSLLGKLAFSMLQRKEAFTPISERDAKNLLSSKADLDYLLNTHLLQISGSIGNREFSFCHQSLQEYYAAEELWKNLPDIIDQHWLQHTYLNQTKWTESIAFICSFIQDNESAKSLTKVAISISPYLGAKLAGEFRAELQAKTVNLIETLKVPRWYKIELLGTTRSGQVLPQLLKYLESEDAKIANRAATAIAVINDKAIVPALEQKLSNIKKWVPSTFPLLATEGEPRTFQTLDQDAVELEARILKILAQLSPQSIEEKIIDYVKSPSSPLMSFLEPDIISTLASFSETTITLALQELKKCNTKESVNKISQLSGILSKAKSNEASQILIQKLSLGEGDRFRRAIINALCLFDTGEVAKALSNLIKNADSSWIRQKTVEAIVKNNYTRICPYLKGNLTSTEWELKWSACLVLGQFGDASCFEQLQEAALHPNHRIRMSAIKLIGNLSLDQEHSKPTLLKALEDSAYSVRRQAAIILGNEGYEEAIPELLSALNGYFPNDDELQRASVTFQISENQSTKIEGFDQQALNSLGDDEAIRDWVWELNAHPHAKIRQELVLALSHLRVSAVEEALLWAVEDGDKLAAIPLAQFGKEEAIPHLIELLKNTQNISNLNIILEPLAKLIDEKNPDLIPQLITLLGNTHNHADDSGHFDYYFRNRLAALLTRLKHESMPNYLSQLSHLLPTEAGEQASWVIGAIQSNFKFYNYEVLCSPPLASQPKHDHMRNSTVFENCNFNGPVNFAANQGSQSTNIFDVGLPSQVSKLNASLPEENNDSS